MIANQNLDVESFNITENVNGVKDVADFTEQQQIPQQQHDNSLQFEEQQQLKQQPETVKGEGDDEALSSLLLLLKSNTKKEDDSAGRNSAQPKSSSSRAKIYDYSQETQEVRVLQPDGKLPLTKSIKVDDLRKYFHLPIVEVAKQLGICTTLLKRICRNNRIKKWPYRQIRGIAKSIQSLEMASLNESLHERERGRFQDQINYLQRSLEALIDDPSISIVDAQIQVATQQVLDDNGNLMPEVLTPQEDNKRSVAKQVMANAFATANSETSESIIRIKQRRKDENEKAAAAVTEKVTEEEEEEPVLINATIGLSTVSNTMWADTGRQKVFFCAPVILAPLTRKKTRGPAKKLIPLIEPDICNSFQMDFLPQSLLRIDHNPNKSLTNNKLGPMLSVTQMVPT